MKHRHVSEMNDFPGYDGLQQARDVEHSGQERIWDLRPREAYDAYHRIHKVFVGEGGASQLVSIHEALRHETLPDYLDAAAWSAAEAALALRAQPVSARMALVDQAVDCWQRAMASQEVINHDQDHDYLREDVATYRFALDLAYTPLMKALVAGDVTESVRERVFVDTISIAQAATVQRCLAFKDGDIDSGCGFIGFEHECNAHLGLLYLDDPRHLPLPSSARAGSGNDYPDQTHDLVVINQHWGNILKVVPAEIKSRASLRDLQRYRALIVRGKMHLSVTGKTSPEHTQQAFAAAYAGTASSNQLEIVDHVTSTIRELLQLYQKGQREMSSSTRTRFHDKAEVAANYPELSVNRSDKPKTKTAA